MGNEIIFFGFLFFFLFLLIKRESISSYLLNSMNINLPSQTLLYIAIGGVALLMVLGILFDNTKEKYSNISNSYNSMRPNPVTNNNTNKPHKFFDIDFDSIFPWK
jgi:uncharacterized membrane protein